MAIIKEPEYELEVQPDEVDVDEELGSVGKHDGELRWIRAVKMRCVTCETEKCFDNSWHAGHIFSPHLLDDDCSEDECEVKETVLLGEQTSKQEARDEIPDWRIES